MKKTNLEATDADGVDGARQSPIDQGRETAAFRRQLPPHASGERVSKQLRQHANLLFWSSRTARAQQLVLIRSDIGS